MILRRGSGKDKLVLRYR